MGTGHGQGVTPRQHPFGQPLRAGNVALASVKHGLHGRVAPRQRVADHHLIGAGRHAVGAIALVQGDAQLFQLGGHRRIDGLVAAADRMAQFPRQGGHAAHEGAGDCKDMANVRAWRCSVNPDTIRSASRSTRTGPTPQEAIPKGAHAAGP
ncbi:hypothetical protein G6F31_016292 [Rhizopus arrhizus]|nr:hypothetical protein G6F31_016292 [Rhizopus arrhizus]